MLAFLVRRLFLAVLVLLLVALIDYAMLGNLLGTGFLGQLKRALAPGKLADVALVQGLALWGAVLIVAVSVLADLVLVTPDPRVR